MSVFFQTSTHAYTESDLPVSRFIAGGYISDGRFLTQEGVFVDSAGNIFVADTGNSRVQKFNSSGEYVMKFGQNGTGDGYFRSPNAIYVDSSGNIYVLDSGNSRVQKFDSSGTFLMKFGSFGSGDGQFRGGLDFTVDPSGNIYVSDFYNSRIVKFNSLGVFQAAYGSEGTGHGSFDHPRGLVSDADGNIYVVDQNNYRIEKFNSSFAYQLTFTYEGDADNFYPRYINIDSNGDIYVTNSGCNTGQDCVVKFEDSGAYVSEFVAAGGGDITIDSAMNIYLNRSGNNTIAKYNSSGVFQSIIGKIGDEDGEFVSPSSVAVDSDGNIYVCDGGTSRVQKFASSGSFITKFTIPCQGIYVDGAGNIYATSIADDFVRKYSSSGELLLSFGGQHTGGNGEINGPWAVTVAGNGDIYVVEGGNARVQVFNSLGVYQSQFGSWGDGQDQFRGPRDLSLDESGNIYVADEGTDVVKKFDSAGTFVQVIAPIGSQDGHVANPLGVTIHNNSVYIADYGNNRIQKVSTSGSFLMKYGLDEMPNDIMSPVDIAMDDDGNIYVVDEAGACIRKFTFDLDSPEVTIDTFEDDVTEDPQPQLTGTVSDSLTPITEVTYSVGSDSPVEGACVAADGEFDELSEEYVCNLSQELDEGSHVARIMAIDNKTNEGEEEYSFVVSLPAEAPSLTTDSVDSVTTDSASVNGEVTSDGGDTITERGVVYSQNESEPTVSDSKVTTTGTTGEMIVALSGLSPDTHYYARVYAINGQGVAYGDVVEFTTDAEPEPETGLIPSLTTDSVDSITTTTATVNGEVTSDGGETITQRGVVYSHSNALPTVDGSKETATGTTGDMTVELSGLKSNTHYYARVYAINSMGVGYGEVIEFVTKKVAVVAHSSDVVDESTSSEEDSSPDETPELNLTIKQEDSGLTIDWTFSGQLDRENDQCKIYINDSISGSNVVLKEVECTDQTIIPTSELSKLKSGKTYVVSLKITNKESGEVLAQAESNVNYTGKDIVVAPVTPTQSSNDDSKKTGSVYYWLLIPLFVLLIGLFLVFLKKRNEK